MKTRLDHDPWDDGEDFLRWEQNETDFPRRPDRYDALTRHEHRDSGRDRDGRPRVRLPLWWRISRWWR